MGILVVGIFSSIGAERGEGGEEGGRGQRSRVILVGVELRVLSVQPMTTQVLVVNRFGQGLSERS